MVDCTPICRIWGMPWFVYDEALGIEMFRTSHEARTYAEKRIRFWKTKAMHDGEWDDEVESVVWGRIHQSAGRIELPDIPSMKDEYGPFHFCDFSLVDVSEIGEMEGRFV